MDFVFLHRSALVFISSFALSVFTTPVFAVQISEIDLYQVKLQGVTLGMSTLEVQSVLAHRYGEQAEAAADVRLGLQCSNKVCTARLASATQQDMLQVQFNQAGKANWIRLESRYQGGSSPEQCLQQAEQQLTALRAQYTEEPQQRRFRPNTVSMLLNKRGHPDPADNSRYGFRAQIKCDPLAKGEAQSEFELRDSSL